MITRLKTLKKVMTTVIAITVGLLACPSPTVLAQDPTEVSDIAGLNAALAVPTCESIRLTGDITTPATIEIPENRVLTLDLNGHTITYDNSGQAHSAIRVETGAELTLADTAGTGMITKGGTMNPGNAVASCGGGIDVSGGSLIMNGGTLYANSAHLGAGIYVTNGSVVMNGGAIQGNVLRKLGSTQSVDGCGGGVYVGNNASFTMNGGTIRGNVIGEANGAHNGGGVYVSESGTFTMNGGTIGDSGFAPENGNVINGDGAGVYCKGTFDFNGGAIQYNHAALDTNGGGIYLASGSTFTMSTAAVVQLNEAGAGAGIYAEAGASFTANGGEITLNKANAAGGGGGIYLAENGSAALNGVSIKANEAPQAGGIRVSTGATLTMTNGEVSGNTASDSSSAGGVQVEGSLTLGGAPVIKNNQRNQSTNGLETSNVLLASGKTIKVSPALAAGADIGVRTADRTDRVLISEGYPNSNPGDDPTKFFKSDEATDYGTVASAKKYYVEQGFTATDKEVYLVLTPHTHTIKKVEDTAAYVAPSCTKAGSKTENLVCEVCGTVTGTEVTEISALGHDYGAWTVVKKPTVTDKGLEESVCTRCGEKRQREIDKLADTKSAEVTTKSDNGAVDTGDHAPVAFYFAGLILAMLMMIVLTAHHTRKYWS